MISIALATYNGERFLAEQIESLLSQTLPFDELVVCDDNSKDGTWRILSDYASRDARVKIWRNEQNLGFKRNFEKAVSLCSGDYIALCDQDDIWLPAHLQTLYDNMGDNYLVCGSSEIASLDGKPQGVTLQQTLNYAKESEADNLSTACFVIFYHNPFQGASMMITGEFARMGFPIPAEVKFHDVWLVALACLCGRFRYVDKVITYYRFHDNNASGKHLHHPRVRTLAGHFVKSNLDSNRKELVAALIDASGQDLGAESRRLLEDAEAYHKRRGSLGGRVKNLLYEVRNWKRIYGRG